MAHTTHTARITGPVTYIGIGGRRDRIPLGPCLVEQSGGQRVDIVWGESGQKSAALSTQDIETAENCGHLVLLDEPQPLRHTR
jgi:hypothetical protein